MDELTKIEEYGKVGLNNRGNTCFLNTTIQCLSHVIPLTNYIVLNKFLNPLKNEKRKKEIHEKLGREFDVTKSFVQLIRILWSHKEPIEPKTLHQSFQKFHDRFEGYHQQDAEEALIIIMDSLHEVLNTSIEVSISGTSESDVDDLMIESFREWKKTNEKKFSVITEIFTGQFMNQVICKEMEDKNKILSRTYENFDRINLPISGNTLYDCLQQYFHVELLETKYHIESEDRHVKAGRQIKLMMLPKYLIIVLKRFQNDGTRITKKNSLVSFPIDDLDLSNYTMGYDKYESSYRLRSIGCHIGNMSGGHYYAICRHRCGGWFVYNDRQCEPYDIKSEIPVLQNRVYMLIYEKKV